MAPKRSAGEQRSSSKKVKEQQVGDEAAVASTAQGSGILDTTDPDLVFARLIAPITPTEFFRDYWEKKPLIISRGNRDFYAGVFSRTILDNALKSQNLPYVGAINVVKYVKGVRHDMNGKGRAKAADVWRKFDKEGGTLQVRHPQHYSDEIFRLLHFLESYFQCLVGANVYATPPSAQGLAPHWDDIEAFVLQVRSDKSSFRLGF
jgi:lysine-specific demethylase/histidyl-hydroxylase NO66